MKAKTLYQNKKMRTQGLSRIEQKPERKTCSLKELMTKKRKELEKLMPDIYSPEFIPYYLVIQKKYNLSDKETLLYGFIRYYISTAPGKKFYFNNKQLAQIIGWKGTDTVSHAITKLKRLKIIKTTIKIKAGGGQIRFISWPSKHC